MWTGFTKDRDSPLLVVTGRHDKVISTTPCRGSSSNAYLRRHSYSILEQSGHYPHIEEPQEFRRIVYEFVESQ